MYKLGKRSRQELQGVHPAIVAVVKKAIKLTEQDFMVFDGMRTKREQRKLYDRGVSKTTNSYHQYGLAVDLVAYVNGKPSWNEKYYAKINRAMKEAQQDLDLLVVDNGFDIWGWDMPHWQLKDVNGRDARKYHRRRKNIGF